MGFIKKVVVELKKVERLQARLEKHIYKKAVRAGAKLVVFDLKARVPVVSGALKQSIAAKVDSPKGGTSAYAVIGPRSSFVKTVNGTVRKPSRYAHFVEAGKFASPFLYPTMQAGERRYVETIQAVLKTEIEQVLNG